MKKKTLGKIIKHDWRVLRADRAFLLVALLVALLLLYGLYNGAAARNQRRAAVESAMQSAENKIQIDKSELAAAEAQGITHTAEKPLWVAHPADRRTTGIGTPPSTLAVLSIGQSDLQPATSDEISQYKIKYDLFKNYEQDNPSNLLIGRFDWSFVIVFLLPLLILALTFNLLSGEREDGTLALTLAQPVSLRAVVVGKIAARYAFVLTFALGASFAGIAASGIGWNAEGTIIRLFLCFVAVVFYAAFWFAIGAFVAARGYSSAAGATALAGIWLALVVVLPSLLNVAVAALYPLPSRLEITNATRCAENESYRLEQQLLGEYFGDHPEYAPPEKRDDDSLFYVNGVVVAEDRERRVAPLYENFERQLANRQNFINRYRFASPAVVMQETINDLAGTGRDRQNRFVAQLRDYFDEWRNFIAPLMFKRELLKSTDYDHLPRFRFQDEPIGEIAARVLVGLIGLLAPTAIFGWLALRGTRNYPVRE